MRLKRNCSSEVFDETLRLNECALNVRCAFFLKGKHFYFTLNSSICMKKSTACNLVTLLKHISYKQ